MDLYRDDTGNVGACHKQHVSNGSKPYLTLTICCGVGRASSQFFQVSSGQNRGVVKPVAELRWKPQHLNICTWHPLTSFDRCTSTCCFNFPTSLRCLPVTFGAAPYSPRARSWEMWFWYGPRWPCSSEHFLMDFSWHRWEFSHFEPCYEDSDPTICNSFNFGPWAFPKTTSPWTSWLFSRPFPLCEWLLVVVIANRPLWQYPTIDSDLTNHSLNLRMVTIHLEALLHNQKWHRVFAAVTIAQLYKPWFDNTIHKPNG